MGRFSKQTYRQALAILRDRHRHEFMKILRDLRTPPDKNQAVLFEADQEGSEK